MKRMLLQIFLSGYAVTQPVMSDADSTAVVSSAASVTTPLGLTVHIKPGQSPSHSRYLTTSIGLWDITAGPVSRTNVITTGEATAVPSSSLVPPPFLAS